MQRSRTQIEDGDEAAGGMNFPANLFLYGMQSPQGAELALPGMKACMIVVTYAFLIFDCHPLCHSHFLAARSRWLIIIIIIIIIIQSLSC